MLTENCDQITLDTSSPEGEQLWRRLCVLVRHTGGVDAPARYYRNKLAQEGLTEPEKQKAGEMLTNWGNQ
jgi:hypothetical protein